VTVRAVTVEFYGISRLRAGRGELSVTAATVSEALAAVMAAIPGLSGLFSSDGRLSPHYALSLNGERFLTDMSKPLQTGDRLLILSADAGG
jgi:molybdopterin converting factor small subunit